MMQTLRTKDTRNIDSVSFAWTLDGAGNKIYRDHLSLNWAKARYAIHADAQVIARSNVARSRTWLRSTKKTVIEHLGGKSNYKTKEVIFPDGTKAKY